MEEIKEPKEIEKEVGIETPLPVDEPKESEKVKIPQEPHKEKDDKKNGPPTRARRIMVGTPALFGDVNVRYANSLIQTIRTCAMLNVIIEQYFITEDAMLPRARNDIFKTALLSDVDDLVFIDADMEWGADQFIRLISHPVDLVAGTARRKTDAAETYAVTIRGSIDQVKKNEFGLMEVDGVGCAFTRFTKSCMEKLWDASPKYKDVNRGGMCRMVFQYGIIEEEFVGEDIMMSSLWKSLGGKVYLDPELTINHIGMKNYVGNFAAWFRKIQINGG